MATIKYPFGQADSSVLAVTGNTAITILNQVTLIDGVTAPLTGAVTINLTIDTNVMVGSVIFMKLSTVGVTTVTLGTKFICPVITGVAGKTITARFYYDGTNFLASSAPYQIN